MSKFTGQLQGPTDPAPVHLQANTGSAATDAVSALSFGLGLYNQYQNKKAAMSKEQATANLNRATTAVLESIESDVAAELSGTKLEFNTLKNIKQAAGRYGVDPLAVRQAVAKFRGKSTNELLYTADAAEQKARMNEIDERKSSEEQLAALAGFLPPSKGIEDISALSDDELHTKILQAKAKQSEVQAQTSMAELERVNSSNQKVKRQSKVREFGNNWLNLQGNQIGTVFLNRLKTIGYSDPKVRKELMLEITEDKGALPALVRNTATASGLSLSTEEVNKISSEMGTRLDSLSKILSREDVQDLSWSHMEEMVDDAMSDLYTRGTDNERRAMTSLVLAKKIGIPPEIDQFGPLLKRAVESSVMDGADVALRFFEDMEKLTPEEQRTARNYLNNIIRDRHNPPIDYGNDATDLLVDSVINDFSGSAKKKQKLAESGVFDSHISGIANGTVVQNLPPHAKDELKETVAPEINRVVASRISSFVRSRQDTQIGMGGRLGASEMATKAFNIDMNTLMIKPTGVLAKQPKQARALNASIQTGLRALENLGASEEEINTYKDEVLMGFGLVRTNLE